MSAATSPKQTSPGQARRRARRVHLVAVSSAQRTTVPWSTIRLIGDSVQPLSARIGQVPRPPKYVWLLVVAALLLHVAGLWYVRHTSTQPAKARKAELRMDFVQPPPPKIEPPKPPPPKPPPKPLPTRHAQVLPPIQEAAPVVSDVAASPSPEPPVAVAPVSAEPPAPPPLPEVAPFGKAGYLNNPAPDYPPMAARQGWAGTVVLHVHVLTNGKPDRVEIQTTSGHAPLDQEAVRAVKTWSFAPAKRGDTPLDGWATVPIEFKL